MTETETYAPPVAARWLPRALALAAVVAGWLAADRIEPLALAVGGREARIAVVVLALAAAVWIVRQGGELSRTVSVTSGAVVWSSGARETAVELDDIDTLGWASSFAAGRRMFPALVLVDRHGVAHRVPGFLADGDGLVRQLVAASGASHLAAWAEAHALERRMGRWRGRLAAGYGVAGLLVAAAGTFRVLA